MDRYEVDNVAGNAPVSRRRCFVRGQVDGVQYITEKLIRLSRKKTKVTVGDPLELHGLTETLNSSVTLARLEFSPRQLEASFDKSGGIGIGGAHQTFF